MSNHTMMEEPKNKIESLKITKVLSNNHPSNVQRSLYINNEL